MARDEYHNLCTPSEHAMSRRALLGYGAGAAAGALGVGALGGLAEPAVAEQLKGNAKQVLFFWIDGGMSQLESWDPKPNTRFGGPFRSIPTKVPGVHFSELLPRSAQLADKLTIVRSMCTKDNAHSSGVPRIQRGDPLNRGVTYPYFGSAVAKLLGPNAGLPPYVWIKPGSGGFKTEDAGFLGAQYGALAFGDGKPPENFVRPDAITDEADDLRNELRAKLNERFAASRRTQANDANSYVFDMARTLMKRTDLFDEASLPRKDVERYGENDLGRHTLIARRMLEAGVRFVKVNSYGWDTHGDNFNAHASLMPKFDRAFSAIIEDLDARGMLDNVLVIAISEFGRTPRVNGSVGRDHWPEAWSVAMAGAGIKPGVIAGETNDEGTFCKDVQYDIGDLFHTWFTALGIDSTKARYMNGTQPLPIAHEEMAPIRSVLA
ncbi:MAG: DUF1501 domain-containing protein [Phycisphaera sp.]|nr:DUF1501 domain-containing protein [Phycisphaera sp.]